MMRWNLAWLAAATLWATTGPLCGEEPAAPAGAAEGSLEEIVDGLRQAQAALRNVSVSAEYVKLHSRAISDPTQRGSAPTRKHISMKFIAEPTGRAWYESVGDQINRGPGGTETVVRQRTIAAFDGQVARTMTGSPDRMVSGDIESFLRWHGADPREFLTHFIGTSIPEYFSNGRGRIVGEEMWEGRAVTVLETEPVENDGNWKYAFWVDRARNHLVVRSIGYRQRPNDPEYHIYTHWQTSEHAEVAPGIWLPGSGLQESFFTPGDGDWELAWSHEGRFSDWRVNIDVPDAQYTFEFPADMIVLDRRPGAPPQEEQVQRQLDAQQAAAEAATKAARAEEQLYDPQADAGEQIAAALAKAQARDKRVLLVFGGNWCGWCIKLHKVFEEEEEIASLLRAEYQTAWIDTEQVDRHPDLAEKYSAPIGQNGVPFLAVLDAEGTLLTTQETGALEDGPKHDPEKVLAFLETWRLPPRDAEQLLSAALARGGEEDKATLVCLGAPWCGWCHVLADFLDEHAELFDAHYVRLKIDLDRMDNADAVAARLRGDSSGGIPWFAVLDAQGQALTTSDGPDGNIGYPAREQEIAHFLTMLETTAPRMTAAERTTVRAALEEAAKKRGYQPSAASNVE